MPKIREKIFKSARTFYRLIIRIKDKLFKDGKKDKRYKKETVFDILRYSINREREITNKLN